MFNLTDLVKATTDEFLENYETQKGDICRGFFVLGLLNAGSEDKLLTPKEDYNLFNGLTCHLSIDQDLTDKIHKYSSSKCWDETRKKEFDVMQKIENSLLKEIYDLGHSVYGKTIDGNSTAILGAALMLQDYSENTQLPDHL